MGAFEDLGDVALAANETARIERLTHHLQRMREDIGEMRGSMREMAAAVTRLAVMEERQVNTTTTLTRLEGWLIDHEQRLKPLEVSRPTQDRAARLMDRVLWAAASASVVFIAAKSGLIVGG